MLIRDFAERFIKADQKVVLEGDYDDREKLEDPGVIYHNLASGQDRVGRDAAKLHSLGLRQAFSSRRREWKYLAGEGNCFALSFKEHSMFTGRAPDLPPPTGKEVKIDLLFVFRVEDGRIVEAWNNGTTTGLT